MASDQTLIIVNSRAMYLGDGQVVCGSFKKDDSTAFSNLAQVYSSLEDDSPNATHSYKCYWREAPE